MILDYSVGYDTMKNLGSSASLDTQGISWNPSKATNFTLDLTRMGDLIMNLTFLVCGSCSKED